jgi:hypothetical protein
LPNGVKHIHQNVKNLGNDSSFLPSQITPNFIIINHRFGVSPLNTPASLHLSRSHIDVPNHISNEVKIAATSKYGDNIYVVAKKQISR